jgi:hypothetical protein
MLGNFAWSNRAPNCDPLYDGEGIMFDTLETLKSNGIWIAKNNALWNNQRYGIHFFWQCKTTNPFTVNWTNNTVFANNASPGVTERRVRPRSMSRLALVAKGSTSLSAST